VFMQSMPACTGGKKVPPYPAKKRVRGQASDDLFTLAVAPALLRNAGQTLTTLRCMCKQIYFCQSRLLVPGAPG
jgi:hypothetical protein